MNVTLCNADALYCAGGPMAIGVSINGIDPSEIASVECSVLWFTEGKGDEDLGVANFVRRGRHFWDSRIVQRNPSDQWRVEDRVECRLPPTPLSYRGHLITVRWCVRLRVKRDGADDVVTQVPFHLVAPEQIGHFRSPMSVRQTGVDSVSV